jgi:hypothetical protein
MWDITHVVACRLDSIALDIAVKERVLDLLDHDDAGEKTFQRENFGSKVAAARPCLWAFSLLTMDGGRGGE